jgi:hypothetical protein
MTVKQQSSLINGIISQEADKNAFSFNRSTSTIISENLTDSSIDIKVVDKGPILVQLRKDTLGDDIVIEGDSYNLSDLTFDINQEDISFINDIQTASISGVSVSYTTPTLAHDVEMNQEAENRWKDTDALDIISELFKLELSKYIVEISLPGNVVIDMKSLDIDSQLLVCDKLPVKITREVMKYIQDVKRIEKESLQFTPDISVPTDITLFDA